MSYIHRCDFVHIFLRKCEIEYIKILLYSIFVYRLRNNYNTSLNIPTQSNLCSCLIIFFANLCENWIAEEIIQSFIERCPSLWNYIIFFHCFEVEFLLEEWVHFYLVNHWLYLKCFAKVCQNMRIAVSHTDCL